MLETVDQIAAKQDHTGRVAWRWLTRISQIGSSPEEVKTNKNLSTMLRGIYLADLTPAERLTPAWQDDVTDNNIDARTVIKSNLPNSGFKLAEIIMRELPNGFIHGAVDLATFPEAAAVGYVPGGTATAIAANTVAYVGALRTISASVKDYQEVTEQGWRGISKSDSPTIACLLPHSLVIRMNGKTATEAIKDIRAMYDVTNPEKQDTKKTLLTAQFEKNMFYHVKDPDWNIAFKYRLDMATLQATQGDFDRAREWVANSLAELGQKDADIYKRKVEMREKVVNNGVESFRYTFEEVISKLDADKKAIAMEMGAAHFAVTADHHPRHIARGAVIVGGEQYEDAYENYGDYGHGGGGAGKSKAEKREYGRAMAMKAAMSAQAPPGMNSGPSWNPGMQYYDYPAQNAAEAEWRQSWESGPNNHYGHGLHAPTQKQAARMLSIRADAEHEIQKKISAMMGNQTGGRGIPPDRGRNQRANAYVEGGPPVGGGFMEGYNTQQYSPQRQENRPPRRDMQGSQEQKDGKIDQGPLGT